MKRTYFVAGGDFRQQAIVALLKGCGYEVYSFGLGKKERLTPEVAVRLGAADVILLPLPAIDSDGYLNAPLLEKRLPAETLWSLMRTDQNIFGGMLSDAALLSAKEYGLNITDYYKREDFVLRNAYITAEGALGLAMQNMKCTIKGTNCLVLGYGRIGKFLAKLLLEMGADVTVAARKSESLTEAALNGYKTCVLPCLEQYLPLCDVVYNTIRHLILDRRYLNCLKKTCLCIDLASKPGGIDFGAAESLGIETIWALGLPGKVAPESAGAAILDTVFQILTEQEMLI